MNIVHLFYILFTRFNEFGLYVPLVLKSELKIEKVLTVPT